MPLSGATYTRVASAALICASEPLNDRELVFEPEAPVIWSVPALAEIFTTMPPAAVAAHGSEIETLLTGVLAPTYALKEEGAITLGVSTVGAGDGDGAGAGAGVGVGDGVGEGVLPDFII